MTPCLDRIQAYLSAEGVHAELEPHPQTFTAPALATVLHEKGKYVAKVFIAWADGDLVMFVLPAYSRVDLSRARELLGCTLIRPATEEEFSQVFTDCEVGAMPPFGNLYQVPVYLDEALAHRPHLVFPAGSHHEALRMLTRDYVRLAKPAVADFVVHGPEPSPSAPAPVPFA